MASKPIADSVKESILADWRTGEYSQRHIAQRYKVSLGFVAKITKNQQKDSIASLKRKNIFIDEPSVVYLIRANELPSIFKVGITNNMEKRLPQLQTGNPHKLVIYKLYRVKNPLACEMMIHSFFHKKRMYGEWFNLSDLDLSYIDDAMNDIDEVIDGL